MANTTVSSVATTGLVCKGYAPTIMGNLDDVSATRLTPGWMWVLAGTANSCTLHNGSSDTLRTPLWTEFRRRTSSTFGEVDIDTAESIAGSFDIHLLDPYNGSDDVEWWAKCNLSAVAHYGGEALMALGGSGDLTIISSQAVLSSATVTARIAPGYTFSSGDKVVKVCKP